MINVLHLIDQYRIGGPGKTIINTAKNIDKNNFNIHIGTFLPKNEDTELSIEIKNNTINFLPLADTRGVTLYNLKSILDYITINKIEIVHSHGYKADLYNFYMSLLKSNQIVTITTHHGWIRNTLSQIILGYIVIKGAVILDHTIIVSQEMEKTLLNCRLQKNKYSVLHNAINDADYKPKGLRKNVRDKLHVFDNEMVLLSVGRLSPEKGCNNLIDAFSKAKKIYNNIKLIFVGDGPLKGFLEKLIIQKKLHESIKLVGHYKHVQPFYEAADLFICPSDTEGLSNVILEAMAFSLPVIATDVGGNREIIKHNNNGILIPPRDSYALSNAIQLLLTDPRKREQLGTAGYITIKRKFSFKERTEKLEKLYQKILTNKKRGNKTRKASISK